MRPHPMLLIAALSSFQASAADLPPKVVMRDVTTHEQIVDAAHKAKEENPMPVFKPIEGADPSVVYKPVDILTRSDILCYQGQATLVPKRAVLHVPKALADRLGMEDGSAFQPWSEFLNANRAWITTVPVSRVQAEGNQPLPEATLKAMEKERRVVIAVYQDGPISVLPLKVPEPAATASATPNVAKP